MQVTNSATIVDYFPEAFIAEACEKKGVKTVVKRFIRRVYFRATGQKSYSTIGLVEAKYDWQCRTTKVQQLQDSTPTKCLVLSTCLCLADSCHLSNIIFIQS